MNIMCIIDMTTIKNYDYQPVDGYIAVPDFPGIGNELTDYCFTNGKVTTVE